MVEALPELTALLERVPPHVRSMMPYRPGKPIEELKEEFGFDRVIKLASNENPFGISPMALKAASDSIQECYRYPDPVSRRLRRKIGERFGAQPSEIAIGSGSENIIAIAIRAFMQVGDKAVTGEGAFLGFEIHCNALGGQLTKVPSPNYRFDPQALINAVTPETKILYLPNPNNPTGTYLNQREVEQILRQVPPTTLILLDEAYLEFCDHLPDYPRSMALRQDNLLIVRTFSKAYGLAGLRIAYAIGQANVIEQLMKVKMTFEPSIPAQAAALASLDDTGFIQKTVENNQREMARYVDFFKQAGLAYVPSYGNFIMVDLGSAERVNRLNDALLKRGIAIRPLGPFGFPHCMRISIGLPEENTALFSALEAILPGL